MPGSGPTGESLAGDGVVESHVSRRARDMGHPLSWLCMHFAGGAPAPRESTLVHDGLAMFRWVWQA
jgi:hypothetical protein